MGLTYTGDELLISIRNLPMIPDNGASGSADADLLRHANEAIIEDLVPEIHQTNEDYFVSRDQVTLVSGTKFYRLPVRAMWSKLKHIRFDRGGGTNYSPLNTTSRKEEETNRDNSDFYIENNYIVLMNETSGGKLEFHYFFRPGDIVKVASARQVSSVNTSTGVVTLQSAPPAAWTTSTLFDIHSQYSGLDIRNWDLVNTLISGSDITFTATEIDGTKVGRFLVEANDWVCIAGEAAVIPLPREWHMVVARAAALRYLEAVEDLEKVKLHAAHLTAITNKQVKSMETRVENNPLKIRGIRGPLYAGRVGWW